MAKTGAQLSTGDQILLTLGCLVFFSMAVAVSGFMAGAETRAKLAAFASEGVASGWSWRFSASTYSS